MICDEVQADVLAEVLRQGESTRVCLFGRSMLPAMFPGVRVSVEPVVPLQCVPGDVVLVRRGAALCAHRWLGGEPGRWALQGDAYDQPDTPISDDRVIGRVSDLVVGRWSIPMPAPVRMRISGHLLRAMPFLRRSSKWVRAVARSPVRGVQGSAPIRVLRRRAQSWTLELLEERHLPEIRRTLLRRGERPTRVVLEWWAELARSEHGAAVIATAGGRIVGHANFVPDQKQPEVARHGYLWVDRWYRSLGIASSLEREIAKVAREGGYRELVTRARWGSDSMRASQRVGFLATRSEDGEWADLRLVLRS